MKKSKLIVAAAAAAALAALAGSALAAGTAGQPKITAFSLSFTGKAVVRVVGDQADITSATATGTGTPTGRATLTGKGSGLKADPCPLFSGPGSITSAKGKLNFTVANGTACTDEGGQQFSIVGYAVFKGGTAAYKLAKGRLKFTGSFSRGTGAFSVKFVGRLTV